MTYREYCLKASLSFMWLVAVFMNALYLLNFINVNNTVFYYAFIICVLAYMMFDKYNTVLNNVWYMYHSVSDNTIRKGATLNMKNSISCILCILIASITLTGCSSEKKPVVGQDTNLFNKETEQEYSAKYGLNYYKIFQFLNEDANPDYYIVQLMNVDVENEIFSLAMNSFAISKDYDIDKNSSIVADISECEWKELIVNDEPMEVQVLNSIEILSGDIK